MRRIDMESDNNRKQPGREDLLALWDRKKVDDLPLTPVEVETWVTNLLACLQAAPQKPAS
jgi:hypothetical protein